MKVTEKRLRQLVRQAILSESRYAGMSIHDIDEYLKGLGNNTWVFFDTETTGLDHTVHYGQLLEIAAVAVNPNNWDSDPTVLGEFDEKIKLNPDIEEKKEYQETLSPEELEARGQSWTIPQALEYTNYYNWDREYIDEQAAIEKFLSFVDDQSNPILVAQNASFDMKWVSARYNGKMKVYPVIDTLQLIQLFLNPMLKTLSDKETYNDQYAQDFLKISGGRAGQGPVSRGFEISTEGHHEAIVDVKMMMKMLAHIIRFLRSNPDLDISAEHGKAATKQRRAKERNKRNLDKVTGRWRRKQRRRDRRRSRREEAEEAELTQQQITQAAAAEQGPPSEEMEDEIEALMWRHGAKPTTVSETQEDLPLMSDGKKASKKKGKPYGKRRRGKTESQAQQMSAGIALSARRKYGKKGAISKLKGAPKSMAAMSMKDLEKLATIRRGSEVPDSTKKGHERAALPGHVSKPKRKTKRK